MMDRWGAFLFSRGSKEYSGHLAVLYLKDQSVKNGAGNESLAFECGPVAVAIPPIGIKDLFFRAADAQTLAGLEQARTG